MSTSFYLDEKLLSLVTNPADILKQFHENTEIQQNLIVNNTRKWYDTAREMIINSYTFSRKMQRKVVTYMDARLEPYRTLVSFLGEALGPDYEVVLHDLTSQEGTIAAIVNNNISGRTEGAPLSNMALRFIHGRVYEKQPYVAGYQGASQAKGRLRSSTMFIKDGDELIGMLCINFDAAKYSRMAQELLALCGAHQEPGPTVGVENFVSSLPDAVQAAISDVAGSAGLPPDRLTMDEKIRIVEDLQQAGIFYMKGAVSEVAAQLGSSEATIYRYLSKLKD